MATEKTPKKAASAVAKTPKKAASAAIKSLKNDVSLIGFGLLGIAFMVMVIFVIMLVSHNPPATNPPPAATQTQNMSPFIDAAPPGHKFVGATKGKDGKDCEAKGFRIVPDTSKPMVMTERGWARPNKCIR